MASFHHLTPSLSPFLCCLLSHSRIERLVLHWAIFALAKKWSIGYSRWFLVWTSWSLRPLTGHILPLLSEIPLQVVKMSSSEPFLICSHIWYLGNARAPIPPTYYGNTGQQHSPRASTRVAGQLFSGLHFLWKEDILDHSPCSQCFSGLNQTLVMKVSQTQGTHFKVIQVPLKSSFHQACG